MFPIRADMLFFPKWHYRFELEPGSKAPDLGCFPLWGDF